MEIVCCYCGYSKESFSDSCKRCGAHLMNHAARELPNYFVLIYLILIGLGFYLITALTD